MINLNNTQKFQPFNITNIHFIGVGGVGMSGIAEILHNLGYIISGSDKQQNQATKRLIKMGCKIYYGHKKQHINSVHAVVISSAVSADNEELIYARKNNTPIVSRAEMLAEIMRFRHGIAVAGTHGKTTTTSLIAHILATANLDPTYIIGGVLKSSGVNAKLGSGDYLVAEADESDSSFLHLQPLLSVITNIDADHMATYDYNLANLEHAFLSFIANLPFYGLCVVCIDDYGVVKIKSRINRPLLTYGFSDEADIQAKDFKQNGMEMSFKVFLKKQNNNFEIKANLIGQHNVLNMLAAISTATILGIENKIIIQALASFTGVARRLEYQRLVIQQHKIDYFDDYGHHPSEIKAVIRGLRQSHNQRLIVVFQPHRYSRTKDLFDDFIRELSMADELILLDIYPANEAPLDNISSSTLAHAIRRLNKVNPLVVKDVTEAFNLLPALITGNNLLLTLGAGNIDELSKKLIKHYHY